MTIWFNLILTTLRALRRNWSSSLFDMVKLWFRFIFSWVVNIVLGYWFLHRIIRSITLLLTLHLQIFRFSFTIFIEIIIYGINKLFISVSLFNIVIFSFKSFIVNCVQAVFFMNLIVRMHFAFRAVYFRVFMIRKSFILYFRI